MEGIFINRHLGETPALLIYGKGKNGEPALLGQRLMPPPGSGDQRWETMASLLSDCTAVLVSGCGKAPEKVLSASGLTVIAVEGLIQDAVGAILDGKSVPKVLLKRAGSCGKGAGCTGTGMGCA
jgi:nitrogen fixation protein NifB